MSRVVAFVLPLTYATIVYGCVFFAQQTINLVAQESAKGVIAAATPFNSDGTPRTADWAGAASAQDALWINQRLHAFNVGSVTGPVRLLPGGYIGDRIRCRASSPSSFR